MAAEKQQTEEALITDLETYRKRREQLAQKFNVIDLPGAPNALAPMHAIGWEIIAVRTGKDDGDFYPQSGKLAPTKRLLNRIAMVAGVKWQRIQRVDDQRRPHARRFEVEGIVLFTDATQFILRDDKELDLSGRRDDPESWSARVSQIVEQAKRSSERDEAWARNNGKPKPPPRDPWIQILQERSTIDERTITGAKNRAIRNNLGVGDTYAAQDAARGFVVFRVFVTGEDEDPYIRREFKLALIQAHFGATAALYGKTTERGAGALPPAAAPKALPASTVDPDDESPDDEGAPDEPTTGEVIDAEAREVITPAAPPVPPDAEVLGDRGADGKWTMVMASTLSLDLIIQKIERAEHALQSGKAKNPDEARAQLTTLRAWKAYREQAIPRGGDDSDTPF